MEKKAEQKVKKAEKTTAKSKAQKRAASVEKDFTLGTKKTASDEKKKITAPSGVKGMIPKALDRGLQLIRGQLSDYENRIYDAYNASGSNSLKIGLSLSIAPGKGTSIAIQADIDFVESRVKDKTKDIVQSTPLFDEAVEK